MTITKSDGRASCPGEVLRALGDGANRRLQIRLAGGGLKLFVNMNGTESRGRMSRIRHSKLTRRASEGMREWSSVERVRNRTKQIPYGY